MKTVWFMWTSATGFLFHSSILITRSWELSLVFLFVTFYTLLITINPRTIRNCLDTLDTPLIIRWNWKNKTNQSTVKDNWRSTPTVLVIILIRINPIDSPKKKTKRFSNENIKFIYRFRWSSIKHLGQLSTLEAISIQSFVILFSTYRESFKITHL